MTPLIDATEMYLRTVWELEEEGVPAIRARLVDRLGLSAPAVSETVHRLEVDGLLRIEGGRALELTAAGRAVATSVMRKHRLAELLLTEVIGLEWEQVHIEACRWEHVISDAVEARLVALLGDPLACPHGNAIPRPDGSSPSRVPVQTLASAARQGCSGAVVAHISEKLQVDVPVMRFLRESGLQPGARADLRVDRGEVLALVGRRTVHVPDDAAEGVYVSHAS